MKFVLRIIVFSFFFPVLHASSPKNQFETQKTQTVSALKKLLNQAEQAKTNSELTASLTKLSDFTKKAYEKSHEIGSSSTATLAAPNAANALQFKSNTVPSGAQDNTKTHSEESLAKMQGPSHYQLSTNGKRVNLFNALGKLYLLVGKHNNYLAGCMPFEPNELVTLEIDPSTKKELTISTVPLGGDLERRELISDEQGGKKIKTEVMYGGYWNYDGICPYREFDAITLKRTDKDIPDDFRTTRGDWGVYHTLYGVFGSLWNGKSRHERHIIASIEGKKKRITMGTSDRGFKIVDIESSQCEYEAESFPAVGRSQIHVIASSLTNNAAATAAGSNNNNGESVVKSDQDTLIVFAGNDTQDVKKAGAPSYDDFMRMNEKIARCVYDDLHMQTKDFLVIHTFNMRTKEVKKHIIPDIKSYCSTIFPDQNGSKIIFACKTKVNQQVYKLLLFDLATNKQKLFEQVDKNCSTYDMDPEDISCVKTAEGKSLIALARGSDIFMIDLNL